MSQPEEGVLCVPCPSGQHSVEPGEAQCEWSLCKAAWQLSEKSVRFPNT